MHDVYTRNASTLPLFLAGAVIALDPPVPLLCASPRSRSRCSDMYRRAVLSVYGCGTSGLRLTGNRLADLVCRRLSVGSVLCSEKSPSDNDGTEKTSAEAENKTSLPPKNEPPKHDVLSGLLSGMKVEVSSKKKFQAMKKKKAKQQSQENTDNIESASRMFQMVAEESHPNEEKPVSKELADAATAVASTYPSQEKQVESELLRQLRLHKKMAEEIRRKGNDDISKVISGMKVTKQRPKTGRQISAEEREFMKDATKKSLHAGRRLKIFPVPDPSEALTGTETPLTLWDLELAKEISYISEHPPRNGFEEMIQWTKEGKLWTFPVDNEAGLDEEHKVEFHEHIFLEKYLEDFPKQGPIRHFMELVMCGLSKNPYLTVQQKKDHIDWFHDYFHKKEDLLKECDVNIN
ncbi:28S ribosomal protein S31, mitochondrial [Hyla sarda]|uniref:28S ribosomal protein S31, mitochondrial n=1 Tax=Hyla sarda TaxID=327740 RepID=UPI0024C34090|nr:28S ribosomal protein S31, mitochondrial [Hyla sarda]